MTTKRSILSYADVQELLDQALSSAKGKSIDLSTYGRAIHFRQNIYRLRTMLREKSREVYQPDDPMYNRTPYDCLTVPNPEKGSGLLRIVKTEIADLDIKDL